MRDKQKYNAYQREYQRRYVLAKINRLRAEWLMQHGPCVKCGSEQELEVDHTDPKTKSAKLKDGTHMWTWASARLAEELSKCQVLCHGCHQKKSLEEKRLRDELNHPLIHGTNNGYACKKCRCPECKQAHNLYNAKYRGH